MAKGVLTPVGEPTLCKVGSVVRGRDGDDRADSSPNSLVPPTPRSAVERRRAGEELRVDTAGAVTHEVDALHAFQLLGRELAQGVEEMALPSRERVARQGRARHDRDGIAERLLQEPAQRRHQPVGEGVEAAQPREAEESRNEDYEVGRQHPELIVVPVMLVPALVPTVVMVMVMVMVMVVVDVMDPVVEGIVVVVLDVYGLVVDHVLM